jgi:FdhD protein
MTQQPCIPVAVVMERVAAPNAGEACTSGETWQFRVVDVVPDAGVFGRTPRKMHDDAKTSRWLYPGLRVGLFADECKAYSLNLASDRPAWFVSWRMDAADPSRVEITAVSLSSIEAEPRLAAEDRVDNLPLEHELCEWLRQRQRPRLPPGRGSSPPGRWALPVSAELHPATHDTDGLLVAGAPRLTQARCELLRVIGIVDEYGEQRSIHIPAERPLTVFVDKRELVTLMTLGECPELLVLGYLRNQRLLADVSEVESVTVDWDIGAAAVRTHAGVHDIEAKTAHRIVTTGCGQGTVFGDVMSQLDGVVLPDAQSARIRQSTLHRMLETMRQQDSIHRKAGSVHGCALFRGAEMMCFVEDVGRHNAIDTIAGWMAMYGVVGGDKAFYTTGRLTSEMVMKAAQLGVPIIVSRNGVTAMGHELASRLGMTLFGRAANRHFLCYTGTERFDSEPEPQRTPVRVVAG